MGLARMFYMELFTKDSMSLHTVFLSLVTTVGKKKKAETSRL